MTLMMPGRWTRWWQSHPVGRAVILGGLSLLGALFLVDAWRGTGPPWSVPFFPGNDLDAAMNLWLLERNLTLLRDGQAMGRLDVLFTTGAFWPDTNTLAWTDNWLVATPLYGLLRQALPPSQAFAALIVACLAGNTLACYRLTRHGATHPLARITAAGLASLSLTIVARMGHAQLLPAFAGILAVDTLLDATGTTRHVGRWPDGRAVLAAAAWLQLQLALGFYLGAFFALACACTAAVLLVRPWNRSSDASGGSVWTPDVSATAVAMAGGECCAAGGQRCDLPAVCDVCRPGGPARLGRGVDDGASCVVIRIQRVCDGRSGVLAGASAVCQWTAGARVGALDVPRMGICGRAADGGPLLAAAARA